MEVVKQFRMFQAVVTEAVAGYGRPISPDVAHRLENVIKAECLHEVARSDLLMAALFNQEVMLVVNQALVKEIERLIPKHVPNEKDEQCPLH